MGRASPAPAARPPLSRARPRGQRVIYGLAGFVKVPVSGKAPRKSQNFLLLGKKQPGTSRRKPSLLHRGWQEPGGSLASPKAMERGGKPNPESNPGASAATACTPVNPTSPTCAPSARGHRGQPLTGTAPAPLGVPARGQLLQRSPSIRDGGFGGLPPHAAPRLGAHGGGARTRLLHPLGAGDNDFSPDSSRAGGNPAPQRTQPAPPGISPGPLDPAGARSHSRLAGEEARSRLAPNACSSPKSPP